MDAYRSWNGILTSCDTTGFAWRTAQEPRVLHFSKSFTMLDEHPTVMQALHYILHEEHKQANKPPRLIFG